MNDSQPLSESTHIELPDVWDQLDEIVKAGESEAAINFLNALPPRGRSAYSGTALP